MSEKTARAARQRARRDVVRGLRRLPDPPPTVNVTVAARHCWRCRLRTRIAHRLLRGVALHNVAAVEYVEHVAQEWQS